MVRFGIVPSKDGFFADKGQVFRDRRVNDLWASALNSKYTSSFLAVHYSELPVVSLVPLSSVLCSVLFCCEKHLVGSLNGRFGRKWAVPVKWGRSAKTLQSCRLGRWESAYVDGEDR